MSDTKGGVVGDLTKSYWKAVAFFMCQIVSVLFSKTCSSIHLRVEKDVFVCLFVGSKKMGKYHSQILDKKFV